MSQASTAVAEDRFSLLAVPPYLRNVWYLAMWSIDLDPGRVLSRTIIEEPVAFFRLEDGSVAALADQCPHRLVPLSARRLLPGDRVQCIYHGLEFASDGRCVNNPHGGIPASARVRSYPVLERHTMLWVWMGDRPANPAAIPDYSCFDEAPPLHVTKRDYIRMEADYELVTDNLLDLSHTAYLHDGILGHQGMAKAEIKVEQVGEAIQVSRNNSSVAVPGLFRDFLPGSPATVDKWNTIRWSAPSSMLIDTGVSLPGDDPANGTGFYGTHILTPETRRSTHYHFAAVRWNVLTMGDELNTRIRDDLTRLRRYAFEQEDAPVIEAQQRMLDRPGAPRPMLLSIDAGPVRYRRLLERLKKTDLQPAEAA